MNTKEILVELCNRASIGGEGDLIPFLADELEKYCEVEILKDGGLVGTIKGESDYTVLLEAHYDQIGFVVTEVTDSGFVKLAAVGGIDERMLPSSRIKILGKKEVKAVFCSVPPHLKKDDKSAPKLSDLYADTGTLHGLSDIVSVGDFAVFDYKAVAISDNYISAPSVDNRAGCAALLYAANLIKNEKLVPTVKFLFADKEELGMRGSQTGAYTIEPDLTIAVDVSFGDTPGVSSDETGKIGGGGMIGISPSLTKGVSDALTLAAKNTNSQFEVMGGRTGTDIDGMSIVKSGSLSGLVSVPIRNMHTSCETVLIDDVESVGGILAEFVKNLREGAF